MILQCNIVLGQTYTLPGTNKVYLATPSSGRIMLKDLNKSRSWQAFGAGGKEITVGHVEGLLIEDVLLYEVSWEFVLSDSRADWLEVTGEDVLVKLQRTRPTSEKMVSPWKVGALRPCKYETITIEGW